MRRSSARAKRREERFKLAASALSTIGVASFVAGFISPAFGGNLGPYSVLLGFVFGLGFHLLGQLVLQYVVNEDPAEEDE